MDQSVSTQMSYPPEKWFLHRDKSFRRGRNGCFAGRNGSDAGEMVASPGEMVASPGEMVASPGEM
ncbi:MAG: hypothetical protein WBO48_16700, partial [Candidatus Promineifilaceae bacterium]